ncbi:hypothetical protein OBBRIDRAFT_692560, partial [Obba rivulosa]
ECLALPGDFSAEQFEEYGLISLGVVKMRLHLGRGYNLLGAVRQAVQHRGAFIEEKVKNSRGTKDNTRAQTIIKQAKTQLDNLANKYNENWDRLASLLRVLLRDKLTAAERNDLKALRRLDLQTDLRARDIQAARTLGDSRFVGSWIWSVHAGGSGREEAERVEWFRARAEKERYDEEVNILHAEFRRTIKSFMKMSEVWEAAARKSDRSPGAKAYAKQKSFMFKRMQDVATEYLDE